VRGSANANAASALVDGERGSPVIHRERSLRSRLQSLLAAALIGVLGVSALVWYYHRALLRSAQVHASVQKATQNRLQGDAPLPPIGPIDPPPLTAAPPAEVPSPETTVAEGPGPAPAAATGAVVPEATPVLPYAGPAFAAPEAAPPKTPQQLAFERRLAARVFGRGEATASADAAVEHETSPARDANAPPAAPGAASLVQARLLPQPHFLLPKGAFIDCTLETAIDSTLPGMTTCVTATDTYGADGAIVLLERGTKLIGETRGQVLQGAARVGVIWSEARTPGGVVVPLDSAATDELGRAGVPGTVDRHFWERFGAAILITTLDGAVQAAVQSTSHGSGTVIYNPGPSTAVATEALKGTVAIAPTLRKSQGDRVQAVVAHDIDFRSVYALRLAAPH
jgi:type IV secretion system protein VirB10